MKKFIVIALLGLFVTTWVHAQYVRKLKEPDFFIPEGSEMHKAEKLPEIKIIPKKTEENSGNKEVKEENDFNTKNESIKYNKKTIKEVPEYKKKYSQYIDDIMRFYSDGTMPKNEQLQKDLEAMNSDEKKTIIAPAPTELTSDEMAEFYTIYQKELNN